MLNAESNVMNIDKRHMTTSGVGIETHTMFRDLPEVLTCRNLGVINLLV